VLTVRLDLCFPDTSDKRAINSASLHGNSYIDAVTQCSPSETFLHDFAEVHYRDHKSAALVPMLCHSISSL
jgi:hypothetical protein